MRIILVLWAVPLCLFWSWYTLSFFDISFGTVFFSRELHDLVFRVYGNTLGVPADEIPAMVAWACAVDTALIGSIAAWRWRAGWFPQSWAYAKGVFAKRGSAASGLSDGNGASAVETSPDVPRSSGIPGLALPMAANDNSIQKRSVAAPAARVTATTATAGPAHPAE